MCDDQDSAWGNVLAIMKNRIQFAVELNEERSDFLCAMDGFFFFRFFFPCDLVRRINWTLSCYLDLFFLVPILFFSRKVSLTT